MIWLSMNIIAWISQRQGDVAILYLFTAKPIEIFLDCRYPRPADGDIPEDENHRN
jgi:hypothetical protein